MLESVPETNQYWAMRVKVLAQGNNGNFRQGQTQDWLIKSQRHYRPSHTLLWIEINEYIM